MPASDLSNQRPDRFQPQLRVRLALAAPFAGFCTDRHTTTLQIASRCFNRSFASCSAARCSNTDVLRAQTF